MKTFIIAMYEKEADYQNNLEPDGLVVKDAKSPKEAIEMVRSEMTSEYFLREETERFSRPKVEDYKFRQQIEDEIKEQLYRNGGSLSTDQKKILYSNIKFVTELLLEEMEKEDG